MRRFSTSLRQVFALLTSLLASGTVQSQTVTNTGPLSFGSFVANTGGSIAMSANGVRSKTGSLSFVAQGGTGSTALFTINSALAYTISLPQNGTVFLTNGGNQMALNNFVSNPSGLVAFPAVTGTQILRVGATLSVGNNQASGNYAGSFNVVINLN